MKENSLTLASGSTYRRELLARLGLPFSTLSPDIDEGAMPGEFPRATAVRLARAKAEAGASRSPEAWIIGSDQVADLAGEAIGKPGTREKAREQLRRMRGHTVLFHTGLCLLHGSSGKRFEHVETTEVGFRHLEDDEIERYLDREPAFDCAGSAKSEGLGIALLDRQRGDDPTALVGLPLLALARMLRQAGFQVP